MPIFSVSSSNVTLATNPPLAVTALLLVHRCIGDALRLLGGLAALFFALLDVVGHAMLLGREAPRRIALVDAFVHGRVADALGFVGRHPALDFALFDVLDLTMLFRSEPMTLARHGPLLQRSAPVLVIPNIAQTDYVQARTRSVSSSKAPTTCTVR